MYKSNVNLFYNAIFLQKTSTEPKSPEKTHSAMAGLFQFPSHQQEEYARALSQVKRVDFEITTKCRYSICRLQVIRERGPKYK